MLDRISRGLWRARRLTNRDEWTARLVRAPEKTGGASKRGLVIVQIDGLSLSALMRAIDAQSMPFLSQLIHEEGYRLHSVYSGLPSSTPAVQAELFFGAPLAVPAYEYVDRERRRVVRMSQPQVAADVERHLDGGRPLLESGASYGNVYRGGAVEARFCVSSLEWTDPFRTHHPLALPALALLHAPDLLRAAARLGRQCLAAPVIFLGGVLGGQDVGSELRFSVSRLAVGVLMRELIELSVLVDLARGLQVVYLDVIGYDECAHRRGPESALARRSLVDIDALIARLVRAARRADRRTYDVWVLSDHGQEQTSPYVERHGRSVADAVAAVFRRHGLQVQNRSERDRGVERARALGRHLIGVLAPDLDYAGQRWEPGRVIVTAQGPLGHVYTPRPLDPDEREAIAAALVAEAGIPLVVATAGPNAATAWTERGTAVLPDEGASILGDDHPFLASACRDLVDLCHHPDAGDLVISGWSADGSAVSFPHENGSHGGPGALETEAFALVPGDTALIPPDGAPLRPVDIRRAALAVRDATLEREPAMPRDPAAPKKSPGAMRIMTYNVHSCVGLDGRLSPERVARVIARYEPDVVALQELDVARPRTEGVDQAQLIAERLEMLMHFHPALTVGEERYGDAVLSRMPMRVRKAGPLPRLGRPRLEPRGAIWVEIDGPGALVQVVNTHLSLHPSERRLQVDALLGPEWLGAMRPGEAVLCGDFNALSWFPVCRRIARRLVDAQRRRPGHRPRSTWQVAGGIGRIDHVFLDAAFDVERVEVAADALARVASDHLPVVVDVRIPPEPAARPTDADF